jgi:taurine dehydrogenase small subunit
MARGPKEPEGRVCKGKAEIGEVLRTRYGQIPDMRWEEMRHWICDDSKAISEWVVRGTPKGGKPFEYLGCDLWEFRDGYVTKKDTYWKYIG